MFHALAWLFVAALLAVWSLTAWLLHAVTIWIVSTAGSLPGAAVGVSTLALPGWLLPWVPPEFVQPMTQLLSSLGPATDNLLQAIPALAGSLTAAAWVVWGIGAMPLLSLGVGLHLLIALKRRHAGGGFGTKGGSLHATT